MCYVTGGSSGLGRALAKDLLRMGAAGVTVVARDLKRLQETEEELKVGFERAQRATTFYIWTAGCFVQIGELTSFQSLASPGQKVQSISCDLMHHQPSSDAFDTATTFHGRVPEYVFNCAGFSLPKFIVDATPEDLQHVRRAPSCDRGGD